MRQENLTTIKGGLNRLRTKGAALKDSLFKLTNGFVTTQKTVKARAGTNLETTLPSGTFGLVAFDGTFHVFASTDPGPLPSGYTLNLLRAPTGNALSAIHFAEPFLGSLYVAAEFNVDETYHFWLRAADNWTASTLYEENELVTPNPADGFLYKATRLDDPFPLWTPNVARVIAERVEPSENIGLYFEVVNVFGTLPVSGPVEPDWLNANAGEEFVDTVDGTPPQDNPRPRDRADDNRLPPNLRDRYDRQRR